jgi:hypothetical protein
MSHKELVLVLVLVFLAVAASAHKVPTNLFDDTTARSPPAPARKLSSRAEFDELLGYKKNSGHAPNEAARFLESAMSRAMKSADITEEEKVLFQMYGAVGIVAFVMIALFLLTCVCMCTCAPEMFTVCYNPLGRCCVRSVCWPVWCIGCAYKRCRRGRRASD